MYNDSPRKICYITTNGAVGGATMHLLEVIASLPRAIEAHVIIGEHREWLWSELERYNVRRYHVPSLVRPVSPLRDATALWQLRSIIAAVKPELIHCHSSKAGILGRIAGFLCGVPVVFTAHGWAFTSGVADKQRLFYAVCERLVAGLGRKIITVSDYDKALGAAIMPGQTGKIVTIHNGIGTGRSLDRHQPIRQRGEPLKLVMVARFSEPKDHAFLLAALAALNAAGVRFQASFVGSGPLLPKTKELAAALGLDGAVRFWGERTDIDAILARHNVFVLTSKWEGFPISILEAMRAGLPVIASDVGGVREAVVDKVTGYLIPRGDLACLVDRLRQLSEDSRLGNSMGLAGLKRFRRQFTTTTMMKKLLAVYGNL